MLRVSWRPGRMRRLLAATLVTLTLFAAPAVLAEVPATEAAAGGSGCTPLAPGGPVVVGQIPHQSTAQGHVFDHGPPRSLLIVTSQPDPIALVMNPASADAVAAVDLNANVLVGLFIGRWPDGNTHVAIDSVRRVDDGVCVTAIVNGPGTGDDPAQQKPYPYHVVTVPKDAVPLDPGTTWTVITQDGTVLATTRTP